MSSESRIPELSGGIGATSLGVARLRAKESVRPDHLAEDPYAGSLMEAAAGSYWAAMTPQAGPDFLALLGDQVAVRTRFFDRALLDAVGCGCAQVVLLACGMDTRAFRLAWPPDTRVFEVDFGEVLAFRDAVLAAHDVTPRCQRASVPADLRQDWPAALIEAGFDPARPTMWLIEGLLYALPAAGADGVLATLSGVSAPGSVLALDHIKDSPVLREALRAVSPELVALWQGGPTEDLAAWLSRCGWVPTVRDLRDVAAAYHRTVPDGLTAAGWRAWLATASR
ncbi:MAG: SAM-dependent methyltransferase [Pseudonocardiaceae bacterium]